MKPVWPTKRYRPMRSYKLSIFSQMIWERFSYNERTIIGNILKLCTRRWTEDLFARNNRFRGHNAPCPIGKGIIYIFLISSNTMQHSKNIYFYSHVTVHKTTISFKCLDWFGNSLRYNYCKIENDINQFYIAGNILGCKSVYARKFWKVFTLKFWTFS